MDGHFLTGSGSKIPMPKTNKTQTDVNNTGKSTVLSVCSVEKTNLVTLTGKEPPKKEMSNRVNGVPKRNVGTLGSKANARSNPNLTQGTSGLMVRSKTAMGRETAGLSRMNPPLVGTKRLIEGNSEDTGTAAKQPKTGFPYKAKSWELKLRLAECEAWVTEYRQKCSNYEEMCKENEEAREKCEQLENLRDALEKEKETLTSKLKKTTEDYEKIMSDSKHFLEKITFLEDGLKHRDSQIDVLQNDVTVKRQEMTMKDSTISQLRFSVQDFEFNVRRLTNQVEDLTRENTKLKQESVDNQNRSRERENEISLLKENLERCEREIKNKTFTISDLTNELQRSQMEANKLNNDLTVSLQNENDLKMKLDEVNAVVDTKVKKELELTSLLDVMKEKLVQNEKLRRHLHNCVQDLKGNIRVFCRVRPPIQSEKENASPVCSLTFPDEATLEISKSDPFANNSNSSNIARPKFTKYDFTFDRVFHPNASQEQVFGELSQLVQSALDGYNVCVFAYGQTGSGKTYTMEGQTTPELRGMIPRTVGHLFESLKDLELIGWKYKFEVCFIEIYNEMIRDLLIDCKEGSSLKINQVDPKTNDVVIQGLTVEEVKSCEQLDRLYLLAHKNRAMAATSFNERSSRSHSITKIRVTGTHEAKKETCYGSLNLVDLAGSERMNEVMSDPRFREMKNINKSLSELGNVILGLLQKQEHIPYRNSKLTHLLQPALGGSSKTLMLVNISPLENCLQETLCSLRFAQKVNQVKIGSTKKRVAYET